MTGESDKAVEKSEEIQDDAVSGKASAGPSSDEGKTASKTPQEKGASTFDSSASNSSTSAGSKKDSSKHLSKSQGQTAPDKSTPNKSSSSAGNVFKFLFNIGLLAGLIYIGFMLYEQEKAVAVLFEQQNSFNTQRNGAAEQISQLESNLQSIEAGVQQALAAARQDTTTDVQVLVQDLIQDVMQDLTQQQGAEIERLENELIGMRLRISNSNNGTNQQWLLAEAASLLRMAQQQLIVARSVRTAQALFIAADDVLKRIDDPAVFTIREILAGELAAVRAVAEVNIQDSYLQLGAVSQQLAFLQVTNDLSAQVAEGERISVFGETQADEIPAQEQGLISTFFNNIRRSLSDFLVVRRRGIPISPLMTPGQEAALVQTVRLQIEQARTALLKGEQEIYTSALRQARLTIDDFLAGEPARKTSILATLDALSGKRIVTELPTLNRTQAALEQLINAGNLTIPETVSEP